MLDDIVGYSANTFGEAAAINIYERVKHCAYLLESNPLLGKREPLLAHRKREYRSLVVHESYKLIYYVGNNYISIAAIWNCKRNPKKLAR